jgi:tRNA uridine 5-carbamoylmethylation protein Kti12
MNICSSGVLLFSLIVLSGGQGSGKSTLAKTLAPIDGFLWSQADLLRDALLEEYLGVDWYNKSLDYKNQSHPDLFGRSPRDMLIEKSKEITSIYGKGVLATHVVKCLARMAVDADNTSTVVVVDDLRRVEELEVYRQFEASKLSVRLTHIHVDGGIPDYDYAVLRTKADYIITRK